MFVKVEEEGHFPSPISFFSAGREYDPLLYSPLQHFILGKVVLSLRSSFIPLHDGNKLFSPFSKNQTDEGGGVISFPLSHRNDDQKIIRSMQRIEMIAPRAFLLHPLRLASNARILFTYRYRKGDL